MKPETPFDAWKRRRRDAPVPEHFADRVLAGLHPAHPPRPAFGLNTWFAAWLDTPLGKVGVCALGCLACVLRVASLVAVFVPR
jgi:hypothetical protein